MESEEQQGGAEKSPDTGAAYREAVRSVMDHAGWHWPKHLLLDPSKGPRFLGSVEELLHELQLGTHMDEVLVLPNGAELLGQRQRLDPRMQQVIGGADSPPAATAYEALERLSKTGMLEELRGKVSYRSEPSERYEDRASGSPGLATQFEALKEECPPEMRHTAYVSEIRRLKPRHCASPDRPEARRWRKSSLSRTMRERAHELGLDGRDMLYWDDYSEGTFIGGDQAGYKIHVDCVQTSNLGTIYSGHKMLAIWQYPQASLDVLEDHLDTHFVPPLTPAQERSLESACKVVLAPPGSVYLFSGCNAHAVVNVGWTSPPAQPGDPPLMPSVCLSSYEALCGLSPAHARAMVHTHDPQVHAKSCWMDNDEDLEDFEEDVAFNVANLERRLTNGQVARGEAAQQAAAQAVSLVRAENAEVAELMRLRPWRGRDDDRGGWASEEERSCGDLGEFLQRKKQRRIEHEEDAPEPAAEQSPKGEAAQ